MNKWPKWLGIFLMLFVTVTAWADLTAVSITASDRGIGFSLMRQTASSFFSLRVGDFEPYQPVSAPQSVYPVLFLAAETQSPPSVIWEKHRGEGWGKVAKQRGLPANYHGKYMSSKHKKKYTTVEVMDDASFEEMMTIRFLREYYNADPELLFYWKSRGLTFYDLFIAVNLGARLHMSPDTFFQLRVGGRDWQFIAAKYSLPYASLSQPVQTSRRMTVVLTGDPEVLDEGNDQDKPEKKNRSNKPEKHKEKKK